MKYPSLYRVLKSQTKKRMLSQARFLFARSGFYTRPSFFIIGAQKCGTTALFNYLSEHPDVVPGRTKEIHFFNREKLYRGYGINYYHSQFPLPFQLGKFGVTFDATPKYIHCPKCPKRIQKYNPKAKMILLLRNPVERAYSAWNMFRRYFEDRRSPILPGWSIMNAPNQEGFRRLFNRREYPSFEEAIHEEIDNNLTEQALPEPSFVRRGFYAKQIERYFKYFHRGQIMIIDSQRLRNDTNGTLEDIAAFVNLRPHDWSQGEKNRCVVAGVYTAPIDQDVKAYLSKFYRPYNERLYKLLSYDFGW